MTGLSASCSSHSLCNYFTVGQGHVTPLRASDIHREMLWAFWKVLFSLIKWEECLWDKPQVESLCTVSSRKPSWEKYLSWRHLWGVISGNVSREVGNARGRKGVSTVCLKEQVSLLVTEPQSCWGPRGQCVGHLSELSYPSGEETWVLSINPPEALLEHCPRCHLPGTSRLPSYGRRQLLGQRDAADRGHQRPPLIRVCGKAGSEGCEWALAFLLVGTINQP